MPKHRWEDSIIMDIKKMGWECRGYIYLCEIDFHGGGCGNGHCRGYDAM
jgi:hypothetical protein